MDMRRCMAETMAGAKVLKPGGGMKASRASLALAAALVCALACGCAFSVDDPETAAASSGARETVTVRGVCAAAGAVPSELASGSSGGEAAGARTAFPSFDGGVTITVTFTDDETLVEYPATVTWDAATRTGSYTIALPAGAYTASAAAEAGGITFMSSGTQTVTVINDGENACDFELSVDSSGSGDGEFEFQLVYPGEVAKGTVTVSGITDAAYSSGIDFSAGTSSISGTLHAGAYRFTFIFYDSAVDKLYQFIETVNIFEGLTTDTWVSGGEYITNNKITVTAAMVAAFASTTFYVDGTNGDDSAVGSYFYPLKTVGTAVGKCARTDGTAYTVYVAGPTAEAAVASIPSGADITITQWDGRAQAEITPGAGFGDESLFESAGTFKMEGVAIDGGDIARAVYVSGGSATFTGCEFTDCFSYNPGGGMYVGGGTVAITDATISGCTSNNSDGGGIHIRGGTLTMTGGKIENCTAQGYGGAISAINSATVTLDGTSISGCISNNSRGGGIYITSGTLTMTGGKIENCTAQGSGGAIYAFGDVTLTGTTISGCAAISNHGGGIYVSVGSATMEDVTISGCEAYGIGGAGGAVFLGGATLTMTGGSISGCASQSEGDGIYGEGATFFWRGGRIEGNAGGSYQIVLTTGSTLDASSNSEAEFTYVPYTSNPDADICIMDDTYLVFPDGTNIHSSAYMSNCIYYRITYK